jgi:hypothetical protein
MNMKATSTWFLRAVLALMALIALAICIFALPSIPKDAILEFPTLHTGLLYIFVGGLYLAVIPFLIALYQSWKLLNHIDKDTAFSQTSVNALKTIKYCGIGVSLCFAATIPLLFQIAELDDAPGLGGVALAFACAPLVISTFAAVLQKLLQNAINIKSENDLTV